MVIINIRPYIAKYVNSSDIYKRSNDLNQHHASKQHNANKLYYVDRLFMPIGDEMLKFKIWNF